MTKKDQVLISVYSNASKLYSCYLSLTTAMFFGYLAFLYVVMAQKDIRFFALIPFSSISIDLIFIVRIVIWVGLFVGFIYFFHKVSLFARWLKFLELEILIEEENQIPLDQHIKKEFPDVKIFGFEKFSLKKLTARGQGEKAYKEFSTVETILGWFVGTFFIVSLILIILISYKYI